MIEIDGSVGEGGGQILRTAIAFSSITNTPCKIFNIRKGRCKPGVKAQHIAGIKSAALLTDAVVNGCEVGCEKLEFYPKSIKSGVYEIDIGTAGAITLVLQTLLPIMLYSDGRVQIKLKGGTAVKWSPTIYYFRDVFCFFMLRMGMKIKLNIVKHGFYPKGCGIVIVETKPCRLETINLIERGEEKEIVTNSVADNRLKNKNVAERQLNGFEKIIKPKIKRLEYVETACPGSFISSHAEFEHTRLGGDSLGERGKSAEDVGKEAGKLLRKQMSYDAPLDEWMGDQILPFMAIATWEHRKDCVVKIGHLTEHTKTNMLVIEKFLPVKFEVKNSKILCKFSG